MKIVNLIIFSYFLSYNITTAQFPSQALTGYWHNWDDPNAPYIPLDQVDARYNIVNISFAVPQAGTDYKMEFIPDQVNSATLLSQIQNLQSQGRIVNISIGGAGTQISLDQIIERDTFINTMNTIINTYGFDGIDIDLEGSSVSVSSGTISNPGDARITNLIEAIKQIMIDYRSIHNRKMFLSMAPETAFVQGGLSAFGGIWGGYLPIIDALRDSIEILHVQLYNSGSMYGIDGNIYSQGTADFIIAMTEATIQGFNTPGGFFNGLPASKIAIGLPACSLAAGGGFTDTSLVKSAIDYLRGDGPQPGSYTLSQINAYPDLRGMMTWSVNWDAINTCGSTYEFAENFENIFNISTNVSSTFPTNESFEIFPNPSNNLLIIKTSESSLTKSFHIYDLQGKSVKTFNISDQFQQVDISNLEVGMYYLRLDKSTKRFAKY